MTAPIAGSSHPRVWFLYPQHPPLPKSTWNWEKVTSRSGRTNGCGVACEYQLYTFQKEQKAALQQSWLVLHTVSPFSKLETLSPQLSEFLSLLFWITTLLVWKRSCWWDICHHNWVRTKGKIVRSSASTDDDLCWVGKVDHLDCFGGDRHTWGIVRGQQFLSFPSYRICLWENCEVSEI